MSSIPYAFLPLPRITFVDANGVPLSGGMLFSYAAGTSTPLATYHLDTLANLTPNPNPIILDATGSCEVRIQPLSYKFVLQNSSGVQIFAVDQVEDIGSLFADAVILNPSGAALQTIAGPLAVTAITVGNGTPLATSNQTGTGNLVLSTSPAITSPSINVLKNTTPITQTGDTAAHTIYTITIPAGAMGPNNQLRITVYVAINVSSGSPVVTISYGGSTIGTVAVGSGLGNTNGRYFRVVGGNLGATNSQSWDMEVASACASTLTGGNAFYQTSTVDSTVNQNLTVTFQGGGNSDSITFNRCLVEIL